MSCYNSNKSKLLMYSGVQTMNIDFKELKSMVNESVEINFDMFKAISDFIFNHPELGGEEYESSLFLGEKLKEYGFEVSFPYEELKTAFIAEYGVEDAKTTIGFIAEYDAIPGFGKDGGPGHACGHNWIAATMCGCAIVMSQIAKTLNCRIKVIGTPAEETFGAKFDLIRLGAFDDVDFAFQAHLDEFTSIETLSLAMNSIEFNFKGLAAHAAQNPEKGINALDAVIMMFNGVNAIREHVKQESRIHGIITYGGEVTNIVPDFAQCKFSIRAKEKAYLNELREKVINIAEGAALCTGATLEYHDYENPFDDMINVPEFANLCKRHFAEFGITDFIPEDKYPGSGSSDIGNVSYVCPTVYLEIAIDGDKPVIVHDESAMFLVNSSKAYELMNTVIKSYVYSAIELVIDDELRSKIKRQHEMVCKQRLEI